MLTGVCLVVTDPGVEGPDEECLVFKEPLHLGNGRRVWLRVFEDPLDEGTPEPVPLSSLVKFLDYPEVACPGFMLVGLNVQ